MDTPSNDSSNLFNGTNTTQSDNVNTNIPSYSLRNSSIERKRTASRNRVSKSKISDGGSEISGDVIDGGGSQNNVHASVAKSADSDENNKQINGADKGERTNFDNEENDKEIEELSKLRCQSVATEVVAERHKRRCSDYPGLAFGRSIFSSNTMMKFSVIKNELHNIMNVQLRRVSIISVI